MVIVIYNWQINSLLIFNIRSILFIFLDIGSGFILFWVFSCSPKEKKVIFVGEKLVAFILVIVSSSMMYISIRIQPKSSNCSGFNVHIQSK